MVNGPRDLKDRGRLAQAIAVNVVGRPNPKGGAIYFLETLRIRPMRHGWRGSGNLVD
jgi:hypothetical protein